VGCPCPYVRTDCGQQAPIDYVQFVKLQQKEVLDVVLYFCGNLYAASTRRAGTVGRHNIGQYTVRTLDCGLV
jgi:hypothetical protein